MSDMNIMPFGACLSDLLSKYNLSGATVSHMLGHKSRTTLRRILTDQANAESMEKFLGEFLSARLLPLTPAEEQSLYQALEASRIGIANYRARMELSQMISDPHMPPRTLYLNATQENTLISLEQFFRQLTAFTGVRMLIINSISAPFFETLRIFLNQHPQLIVDIRHYVFLNDDISRTVRFINATLPLLCFPCYHTGTIPPPSQEQSQFPVLTASVMVCQGITPDGRQVEYQLGFTTPLNGHLLTFPDSHGVYEFWESMISPSIPMMHSIKTELPSTEQADSYLALIRMKRSLEENRAIYTLNPVFCLPFIPPSIVRNYLDSLDDDPLGGAREEFLRIHQQRFDNVYGKKRVSQILAPLRQLRTFARSGRLSDPIFRFRPFTVEERRQILTHFRDQTRDNPYFNICFLKNDSPNLTLSATCCDPAGVVIHTEMPGHTDVLISQDDFTALFSQFFRETLIPHHTLSVSAGVAVLNSLIDGLPAENS